MNDWLKNYIAAQHKALDSVSSDEIARAIQTVRDAWKRDAQVFILGNGGSAANAAHFVTDLGKCSSDALPRPFRVMSLADHVSWITALGNDYSYEEIFVRQLRNFARPGDVLIAISVSGNSPNLVKAFEWASANNLETLSLVGARRGRLAELSKQTIVVQDTHYGRVEDVQMHVLHMICYAFVENPDIAEAE